MKKRTFLVIAILGAAVFIISGCTKKNNALLYRVTGNGLEKPSYIFGTHHMAPVSFLDEVPGFRASFDSADAVVGELLMSDMPGLQMAMMPHMGIPEGKSYKEMLSEEDYALLDESLRETVGAGMDVFASMHPAALNMVYTVAIYGKLMPEHDMSSHVSIDQYLQVEGSEEGKVIIGIETVEDQINALFYSEPVEVMAQSLVEMARNPEYYIESTENLNKYYRQMNLDKLYKASFENPKDPYKMEEFEKALVKERNDKWMTKLPGLMKEQSCFVAVGAGHLPGPDGILTQLRRDGYTVEAVK